MPDKYYKGVLAIVEEIWKPPRDLTFFEALQLVRNIFEPRPHSGRNILQVTGSKWGYKIFKQAKKKMPIYKESKKKHAE